MNTEQAEQRVLLHLSSRIWLAMLLVLFFAPLSAVADEGLVLEVMAGRHDRKQVVVAWELPPALGDQGHFVLNRVDTGQRIPVQVDHTGPPRLVWMLRETLPAGQTRRYRLTPAEQSEGTSQAVVINNDGERLTAKVGVKPVLVYNKAVVPSPIA